MFTRRGVAAASVLALLISPLAPPAGAKATRTRLSITTSVGGLDPGNSVVVFGKLRSKKKACVRKVTVKLAEIAGTSHRFVATTKTNRAGVYAFRRAPNGTTEYRVRYAGGAGCKASWSARRTVTVFEPPPPFLEGPTTDPAQDHIPDSPFPDPEDSDFAPSELLGEELSTVEFLIAFSPTTTVQQANDLLNEVGGVIVGGNPVGDWVLVRLNTPLTADGMLALLDQLENDPRVDLVTAESFLQPDVVPGPDPNPVNPPGQATNPAWDWSVAPAGGNWGLEAVRAPAAWNLLGQLRRAQTISGYVGHMDQSFDPNHPDLAEVIDVPGLLEGAPAKLTIETMGGRNPNAVVTPLMNNITRKAVSEGQSHGTGAAGLIGARYGNLLHLDGIAPMVNGLGGIVGFPMRGPQPNEQPAVWVTRTIDDMGRMFRTKPIVDGVATRLAIYSISQGLGINRCAPYRSLPWMASGVLATPAQQTAAQRFIRRQGAAFARIFPSINDLENGILLFSSAGNMSDLDGTRFPQSAVSCPNAPAYPDRNNDGQPDDPGNVDISTRWNSPWCHASVALAVDGILCVEAVTRAPDYPRGNFSNGDGSLAAPGDDLAVLSSTGDGTIKYPSDGTSWAAPMAAGAAAYLHVLSNRGAFGNRPEQEMSLKALVDLLFAHSRPNTADRTIMLDVFSAAMSLDTVNGNMFVQRELVDVDDGSKLDGNARDDVDDDDGDGNTSETFTDITTPDGLPGDGIIDMKDFRALRDALLITLAEAGTIDLRETNLTGPPLHYKRDLNLDGCLDQATLQPANPDFVLPADDCTRAPNESVHPRFDFNGDGKLDGLDRTPGQSEVAPFKIDPDVLCFGLNNPVPGCLRDIDVMADPDLWVPDKENVVVTGPQQGTGDCTQPSDGWQPATNLFLDRAGDLTNLGDDKLDYVLSADLHLDIGADPTGDMDHVYIDVDAEIQPNTVDDDGDGRTDEPFEDSLHRCFDIGPEGGKTILTIPLYTGKLLVTVSGEDEDVDGNGELTEDPYAYRNPETGSGNAYKFGEDILIKVTPQT